jgi:hypothetical protein
LEARNLFIDIGQLEFNENIEEIDGNILSVGGKLIVVAK